MQYGGVIPASGFPRDGGTAKEGHRKDDSITVQNSSISYNVHSVHGGRFGGYTFEASNRDGSRSAKEVVVHSRSGGRRSRGDVEEVVVHGDGIRSSGSHLAIVQTP